MMEDDMFGDRRPYGNRRDAGRDLARHLQKYAGRIDVIVLALPRGGVPVAYEVAEALGAPLDLFLVRKLGSPGHVELAMGAIASGGIRVLNEDVVHALGIRPEQIDLVAARERVELERREREYREGRPSLTLAERTVIIIDDGLATGSTMRAAVQAIRQQRPGRVVVAVPVGAPDTCEGLRALADEVVCARMPVPFSAVGQWYDDFSQTSDEEVRTLLRDHAALAGTSTPGTDPASEP
jgi:predicted phosphoribosyltransferase